MYMYMTYLAFKSLVVFQAILCVYIAPCWKAQQCHNYNIQGLKLYKRHKQTDLRTGIPNLNPLANLRGSSSLVHHINV